MFDERTGGLRHVCMASRVGEVMEMWTFMGIMFGLVIPSLTCLG